MGYGVGFRVQDPGQGLTTVADVAARGYCTDVLTSPYRKREQHHVRLLWGPDALGNRNRQRQQQMQHVLPWQTQVAAQAGVDLNSGILAIVIAKRTLTADAALLSLSCARKRVTSSLCIWHGNRFTTTVSSQAVRFLATT